MRIGGEELLGGGGPRGLLLELPGGAAVSAEETPAAAALSYLFLGIKKVPCEQAGDVNDDGVLDISDAVYVLSFLFQGGKPIEPPVGTCGLDPTGHTLPCTEFPGCP